MSRDHGPSGSGILFTQFGHTLIHLFVPSTTAGVEISTNRMLVAVTMLRRMVILFVVIIVVVFLQTNLKYYGHHKLTPEASKNNRLQVGVDGGKRS